MTEPLKNESKYSCDSCDKPINVEYSNIYYHKDLDLFHHNRISSHGWQSDRPFAIEKIEGEWTQFCSKVCAMRYERSDEPEWDESSSKRSKH
jgi:hypothetical protein